MKYDIPTWKFIFDMVQTGFTAGIAIYVWILSKHKANASRIASLESAHNEEMSAIKNRLTEIETTVKHMPDRTAIGNIHKRLDEQAKTLHTMEGQLKGLNDTSAMILQALISKGDKAS